MLPPPAPLVPQRPGGPSRVIQGFFPGGQPRNLRPATPAPRPAPIQAKPASIAPPARPGVAPPALRPGIPPGRPQPIQPKAARPGPVPPPLPTRPTAPPPIQPHAARPSALQPSAGNAFALPPGFALRPSALGQRLPEPVQRKMEAFFKADFSDVRVHVGPQPGAIGALAFTHGTDLYFAPGQYNPESHQGQRLLGHELTHVVQQRAGRVRNPLGAGVAVVQDPGLEAEAERMGTRAATSTGPAPAIFAGVSRVPAFVATGAKPPQSLQRSTAPVAVSPRAPGSVLQAKGKDKMVSYSTSKYARRAKKYRYNHGAGGRNIATICFEVNHKKLFKTAVSDGRHSEKVLYDYLEANYASGYTVVWLYSELNTCGGDVHDCKRRVREWWGHDFDFYYSIDYPNESDVSSPSSSDSDTKQLKAKRRRRRGPAILKRIQNKLHKHSESDISDLELEKADFKNLHVPYSPSRDPDDDGLLL